MTTLRSVRSDKTNALENGTFKIPISFVEKIEKLHSSLAPNQEKTIIIPWSDFQFTEEESWPRDFKRGLDNYLNWLYQPKIVPKSSREKKYLLSPLFTRDTEEYVQHIHNESKQKNINRKEELNKFIEYVYSFAEAFTERELYDFFSLNPEYLHQLSFTSPVSNPNLMLRLDQLDFLLPLMPRYADKNGIRLTLVTTVPPSRLTTTKDVEIGGIVSLSSERLLFYSTPGSYHHECIHIYQIVGNNLLFSLKMPEQSFITGLSGRAYIVPQIYGTPKRKYRKVQSPGYYDDSMEFYPVAHTMVDIIRKKPSRLQEVMHVDDFNFSDLLVLNYIVEPHFWQIFSPDKRFRMLLATYEYGLKRKATEEEREKFKSISLAMPEEIGRLFGIAYSKHPVNVVISYLDMFLTQLADAFMVHYGWNEDNKNFFFGSYGPMLVSATRDAYEQQNG